MGLVGEKIDLNQGFTYTAEISSSGSGVYVTNGTYSDGVITLTLSDGSTQDVDISALTVVSGDNLNLLYIGSSGTPTDSGISSSSVFLKDATSDTVSTDTTFSIIRPSTIKLLDNNNSPTKNDLKYFTEDTNSSSIDENTALSRKAILNLYNILDDKIESSTGSSAFNGTPTNIIILDSEGEALEDSGISINDIFLLDSDTNQVLNSDITMRSGDFTIDADIPSTGVPTDGYLTLNRTKPVAFIRSVPDTDTSGISILTHDGVQSLINDATLTLLTPIKAVLEAVDFNTAEPTGNTTGDRYINTNDEELNSSSTSQLIPALAICEWNGSTWDTTIPSLGWSPLNKDTETYWRLVEDDSAADGKSWEDPETTVGINHDTASNVRDTDGNPITGSNARHPNHAEATAVFGGGNASAYHEHDVTTSSAAGYAPVLPATTNNQFLKDTGVWADVELGDDSDFTDLSGTYTVRAIGSDAKGVRLNNSFRYAWRSSIDPTGVSSFNGYKITLPQGEYYLKAKVYTNYGGYIEFEVSCKNFATGIYKARVINDFGVGSNVTSGIKLYIANVGKDISVDATNLSSKFPSIDSALSGAAVLISEVVVQYDSVPASHDIVVSGISSTVTDNFSQPTTSPLSTNNTWTGTNTFNGAVTIGLELNLDGNDISGVESITSNEYYSGGLSDGDKLVYSTSTGITKDVKEQSQTLSITGTMANPYTLNIESGKDVYLTIDTATSATSTLTLSNFTDGDEMFIKMEFTESTTITWNFPTSPTGTIIAGETGTSYAFSGNSGSEYWIGIKLLGSTYNVIINKIQD